MGAVAMTNNKMTPEVKAVGQIPFEGNIIPHTWFGHLRYDTGKPHVNAIIILSEIVYWYRPKEVKEEPSGRMTGYCRKFAADKLQRSYRSFADQFGLTKKQVRDAIDFLEDKGVITIELRKLVSKTGKPLNHVLYIGINPEQLRLIPLEVVPCDLEDTPCDLEDTPCIPESQTYTETTTETTTEIGAAEAASRTPPPNSRQGDDFLPPAETQIQLLFAGRTNGDSTAYEQAEMALMHSGWHIRKKETKDAAIHFLAATGWEVPNAPGIRADWIKQLNEHVTEFGTHQLYDLYSQVFKTADFNLSRPGSFTRAMSAIKNNGSSDRKHVKDDWINDPQYQTFAGQMEEEYVSWSTILTKNES
jgi:hypothetical protein